MSVASSTVGSPTPFGVFFPRHRPRLIVPIVAMTLCWSCSGGATDAPVETAGREAFIGAYLDLRIVALSLGSTVFGDQVRDSVLTLHGVTEQDLRDFIDTYGEDVEFMRDLWIEVEARLTERLEEDARAEADDETADENRDGDGSGDGDGDAGV